MLESLSPPQFCLQHIFLERSVYRRYHRIQWAAGKSVWSRNNCLLRVIAYLVRVKMLLQTNFARRKNSPKWYISLYKYAPSLLQINAMPYAYSSCFQVYCRASSLDIFFTSPSIFSIQSVLQSHTRSLINITFSLVHETCAQWFCRTWRACNRSCTDFVSPCFQYSVGNPGEQLRASTYLCGGLSDDKGCKL